MSATQFDIYTVVEKRLLDVSSESGPSLFITKSWGFVIIMRINLEVHGLYFVIKCRK
jgi:hypothetical protein